MFPHGYMASSATSIERDWSDARRASLPFVRCLEGAPGVGVSGRLEVLKERLAAGEATVIGPVSLQPLVYGDTEAFLQVLSASVVPACRNQQNVEALAAALATKAERGVVLLFDDGHFLTSLPGHGDWGCYVDLLAERRSWLASLIARLTERVPGIAVIIGGRGSYAASGDRLLREHETGLSTDGLAALLTSTGLACITAEVNPSHEPHELYLLKDARGAAGLGAPQLLAPADLVTQSLWRALEQSGSSTDGIRSAEQFEMAVAQCVLRPPSGVGRLPAAAQVRAIGVLALFMAGPGLDVTFLDELLWEMGILHDFAPDDLITEMRANGLVACDWHWNGEEVRPCLRLYPQVWQLMSRYEELVMQDFGQQVAAVLLGLVYRRRKRDMHPRAYARMQAATIGARLHRDPGSLARVRDDLRDLLRAGEVAAAAYLAGALDLFQQASIAKPVRLAG